MPDNSGNNTPTLGEMLHSNHAAIAAAAAKAPPPPPDPVIPEKAAEAAARKAEIMADPKWRDEYLGGSKRHAKELRDLDTAISKESNQRTEMAVAGQLYDGIQPSGHLDAVGTAQMLRDINIGDDVVRQVLTGGPVSQEERANAAASKTRLMENREFQKRYTSGDAEARRQMTLLNVILNSPIKRTAAA